VTPKETTMDIFTATMIADGEPLPTGCKIKEFYS
jgi:hypothetical protein